MKNECLAEAPLSNLPKHSAPASQPTSSFITNKSNAKTKMPQSHIGSRVRRRTPPRGRRQFASADNHGRRPRRPSAASSSSSVHHSSLPQQRRGSSFGRKTELLQHGVALITSGLMALVHSFYARGSAPSFNRGIDWFISLLLDNRPMLSGNPRYGFEVVERLAADLAESLRITAALDMDREEDGSTWSASMTRSTPSCPMGDAAAPMGAATASASAMSLPSSRPASLLLPATMEERKKRAASEMKRLRIHGCYGCLQRHKFDGFRTCVSFCPFCYRTFQATSLRHFPMACSQRPGSRREMIDAIKRAERASAAPPS